MTTSRIQIRAGRRSRPRMEMTALIDCVFLLLIFFLLTASYSTHQQMELELTPLSTGVSTDTPEPPLLLEIRRDGQVYLEDLVLSGEQWRQELSTAAHAVPPVKVQVAADLNAPAGMLLQMIDAARERGLEQLEFTGEMKSDSNRP